jgi:hypothetical protein
MADEHGRPTVSTYYDAEGMTPEDSEAKDKQILAVAGPWRRSIMASTPSVVSYGHAKPWQRL